MPWHVKVPLDPFPSFTQAEAAMREHIEESQLTNSPAR